MNVLSMMMDEAARNGKMGYHPRCKNIGLTHLCFGDDLMSLSDGHLRSDQGILSVFDNFARYSCFKKSLEKSTIYPVGVSAGNRDALEDTFSFDSGTLPVRYLGLPLLTKGMTVNDYL